jgi:hypothetical protein
MSLSLWFLVEPQYFLLNPLQWSCVFINKINHLKPLYGPKFYISTDIYFGYASYR